MTRDVGWPAPAKLNLMLRIVGRRADGYHELQTVFQFLDLADRLHFDLRGDAEVRRVNDVAGVAEQDDLVVRAARLLQQATGAGQGVDIRVEKHIPMGAGLGGGSSDAATTLVVLNRLWGCGLDIDALAQLGVRLGADVPVFVRGHAAWAEGVGEEFQVFDGTVEFTVPIVNGNREIESLALDVTVRFQACDDKQCFLPQTKQLRVEVPLAGLNRPKPKA